MIDQDDVLRLIEAKGPVLPVHIAKEIKQNLLFTSAILADLVSQKKLKLTYLKVGGGSPIYYLPNQEEQLQKFLHYLPESEKNTADLLKKKKVLRDSELAEATRVSLRAIKDFAAPLQVTIGDNKELFWKWYLLSQAEATDKIKELLGYKIPQKEAKIAKKAEQQDDPKDTKTTPEIRTQVKKPQETSQDQRLETHEKERVAEVRAEKIEVIQRKKGRPKQSEIQDVSKQDQLDAFLERLRLYFQTSNIGVLETTCIKKNKEYEFILTIASIVGPLKFYCKAKNGKRINEGDLSAAFIIGQSKKLATIFMSTGTLTKGAAAFLEKELPGVCFKTIDHGG